MAQALDLQEQEQLEEFKAFWSRYGNLITWAITLALLGFAGWNGWGWYQRSQAGQAAAMFDQLDRAVQAGDADRVGRIFDDLRQRYAGTLLTQQGGLLAATAQVDKGRVDAAKATLGWLVDNAGDEAYRGIAGLRLAGLLLDGKQYDAALKALDAVRSPSLAGLVADRRGDVLLAQGHKDEARAAYQLAYKALDARLDYRRLVEAKLTALGAPPAPGAAA